MSLKLDTSDPLAHQIQLEIKANNDRNVLCVENYDCPPMVIDLEVSCSTLRDNLLVTNLCVGRNDKKIRRLEGNISQEQNSCFKLKVRPFSLDLVQNQPEEAKEVQEEAKEGVEEEERSKMIENNGGDVEFPVEDRVESVVGDEAEGKSLLDNRQE